MFLDLVPILASAGGGAVSSGVNAPKIDLHFVDYTILAAYIAVVIGIGFMLKRQVKSANDFFLSGKSIPAWITGLAFLSANLGAQEVIGMAASGAKYGIMTSHFYWVGAIPAMIFLAIFMMPFYYGSKARSVPEYLKLRFDEKTRGLNSIAFAAMTVASSGASLHALAALLKLLLGWDYNISLLVSSVVVLAYVLKGGLTSAIYTEVLQFFLIVLGFAPLVILGLENMGGWENMKKGLDDTFVHSWKYMGTTDNPMGVEWFAMVFGLGFVLSFGYWCTDFLVVQRAMAAKSMNDARRTPIIGAVPKMLFPVIVILPGIIALALMKSGTGYSIPGMETGNPDYNLVIPSLIAHYLPTGLLGLALTALMASFMSGMAGNVTAFNTVWTYDIYQSYIAPNKSDSHYMWMGKVATVAGILISIAFAYVAKNVDNIMDFLQLVFGFVNAPVFATFLLGMFWKRATGHGAFFGLLGGTLAAAAFHGLSTPKIMAAGEAALPWIKGGYLGAHYQFTSSMAQNFWLAIVAWSSCFILTIVISLATARTKEDKELVGLVYSLTPKQNDEAEPLWKRPAVVGTAVLVFALILNIIFW
ncbi:sodium:solute symporter family protein [Luteolibacter soli]|uniref:Sodium:solute symporter family protein n=1 Tax=Luteolibacter soli TaxID=3135280 RepID=A0ABU9AX47_9BACT